LTAPASARDHRGVPGHEVAREPAPREAAKRLPPALDPAGPGGLWSLQRAAGNRAVSGLLESRAGLQIARETALAGDTVTAPYYRDVDRTQVFTLPDGAPKLSDTRTIWNCPTSKIKYSQNSIDFLFSSKTPGGAVNLRDAIANLKSGADTLEAMPPLRLVFAHQGAIITLDNRRLYVAKQANKGAPRVRWATAAEYSSEYDKFTAGDFGAKSIEVRNVPGAVRRH
jgi:hypothetical protein